MTVAGWLVMYRARDRVFGRLPEPQWRMLLDLFGGNATSVTSLCLASGVPPTTALRHIGEMEAAGWIARAADDLDRRVSLLLLTPEGADLVKRATRDAA